MSGPLLHGIWTGLLLLVFVGVIVWVYFVRSREHFDEAARLPLEDDDVEAAPDAGPSRSEASDKER